MAISLAACGGSSSSSSGTPASKPESSSQAAGQATETTLWIYPIGSWKDSATAEGFVKTFNEKYPDIKVEYLDYTSGDDQATAAIEAGATPDIIFEGPERLVSNWGAQGKMVDLSELWTDEAAKDISKTSEAVVAACESPDGATSFQTFWRIKWPSIMPTTLYILVITTINSFQCYALIQLLTSGGPENSTSTIMYYIYYEAFKLNRYGYGNAMGVILAIIIAVFSAIQFKLTGSKES